MPEERLPNVVHRRVRQLGNGLWEMDGWLTDDFPDGAEVETIGDGWIRSWTVSESQRGLVQVSFARFRTPGLDNVWFVNVDEPKAEPSATNLVAFVGDELPAGTIVSRYAFATMGVHNDRQAGAVRWHTQTGVVHQVYVAPEWRRLQLATRLLYTANAFNIARDWPGHLHGDGRRTELGEFLALASLVPRRFGELKETMPPMDARD
ncbi:MAG TPA: GNAT family N-acetyltransferase [Galbitalea sp.]